ncbi:MAG TPA: hypothetical protein VNT29_00545 [Candidatus Limnocylindrales bacterium]|nr:hypothetical protein [Candidatus Limnocylindrales bacterium]
MSPHERDTILSVAVALEACGFCKPILSATLRNLIESAPIEMVNRSGVHSRATSSDRSRSEIRSEAVSARRVPPLALSHSLFDSLHLVEGRWMRLGDMRKSDCYSAAAQYDRVASKASSRADAFRKIATVLSATKTIAENLTLEKLVRALGGNSRADVLVEVSAE